MFLTDQLTTQMGTFALLPQVVRAVNVPVIAAGGIADAAGVAAAMALGAAGVTVVPAAYSGADRSRRLKGATIIGARRRARGARLFISGPIRSCAAREMVGAQGCVSVELARPLRLFLGFSSYA